MWQKETYRHVNSYGRTVEHNHLTGVHFSHLAHYYNYGVMKTTAAISNGNGFTMKSLGSGKILGVYKIVPRPLYKLIYLTTIYLYLPIQGMLSQKLSRISFKMTDLEEYEEVKEARKKKARSSDMAPLGSSSSPKNRKPIPKNDGATPGLNNSSFRASTPEQTS